MGWNGKSKGSVLGYKIFIFTIKYFGIGFAYLILRFVTFYYFLFAKDNKEALLDFYTRGLKLNKSKAKKITKANFYIFGQTLIDRVAFLTGLEKKYTYSFENESTLIDLKKQNKGAILLSAHVGNWETSGNLLKHRVSNKVNVVMLDEDYKKIKDYMSNQTGGSKFNIIPIKNDLSHIIKIKNALNEKEFIAIHADRCMEGIKSFEFDFLGEKVDLPYGPFLIAAKFKVPVVFVFGVKTAKRHYSLSAFTPDVENATPEKIAQQYITKLEEMVKKHPEQWFNYYKYLK